MYKGRAECDTSIVLEELNIQEGVISFSTKMKIGNIEDLFAKQGLKVQIASTDDTKLCDNDYTLAKAKERYQSDTTLEKKENKKMSEEKAEAIRLVQESAWNFEELSEELRADKEVVLEAVKKSGRALEYASEELRSDREVVLEAVKQYGGALRHASEELRSDREMVLEAVKGFGSALRYASEELRSDEELLGIYVDYMFEDEDYNSVEEAIEDNLGDEDDLVEAGFDVDLFKKIANERFNSKVQIASTDLDDSEEEIPNDYMLDVMNEILKATGSDEVIVSDAEDKTNIDSFKEKIKGADYIELYEIFKEVESLKETLEADEYRNLHQELYNASLGLVSYSGYERVVAMVSAISHYSQEEMPLEEDLAKAIWMMSKVAIRKYYESIDEEFSFENIEHLYNLGKIQAISAFISEDDSPMYRLWMKDIGLKTISDDDTELISNALLFGFFLLTEKASTEIQEKYQEDLDATISDQFDLDLEDLIMEYSDTTTQQEVEKLINIIYEDVSSSATKRDRESY